MTEGRSKLEFDVAVYSRLARKKKTEKEHLFVLYVTSDSEVLETKMASLVEASECPVAEVQVNAMVPTSGAPFHCTTMYTIVSDVELPSKLSENVVYAGEGHDPNECYHSAQRRFAEYVSEMQKGVKRDSKTYLNFLGKEIVPYMRRYFIDPMLEARSQGSGIYDSLHKPYDFLKFCFLDFSKGSPFERDAIALTRAVEWGINRERDSYVLDAIEGNIRKKHLGP